LESGSKTQASLADAQAPLHCGVLALPHEVLRHSQDAVPRATPHVEPGAQEPVHLPFLNVQPMLVAKVVVVVEPPAEGGVVVVVDGAMVVLVDGAVVVVVVTHTPGFRC
jgi:hypothetical protein